MKGILLVILFLPIFLFGQNCKYEKNEVDKFTQKQTIITSEQIAWKNPMGGNTLSFKFQKVDGNISMWMRYSMSNTFAVSEGSKFMLLTDNGTIELPALESKVSDHYSSTSFLIAYYAVTPENFEKLLNSTVTDIRFYTTDGYIEHTLKKNKQSIFAQTSACIKE